MQSTLGLLLTLCFFVVLSSCDLFKKEIVAGGDQRSLSSEPIDFIVRYSVGHKALTNQKIYLLEIDCSLGLLMQAEQTQVLVTNHWKTDSGDHFALLYDNNSSDYFFVPNDRAQDLQYYHLNSREFTHTPKDNEKFELQLKNPRMSSDVTVKALEIKSLFPARGN